MEVLGESGIPAQIFSERIASFCRDINLEETHPDLARSLGTLSAYLQKSFFEVVAAADQSVEEVRDDVENEVVEAAPAPKVRKSRSRKK
jgi:hypothetical protein